MSDSMQDVQLDLNQKETNPKSLTPGAQGTAEGPRSFVSEQNYKQEEKNPTSHVLQQQKALPGISQAGISHPNLGSPTGEALLTTELPWESTSRSRTG